MELGAVQAISKVPNPLRFSVSSPSLSHFLLPKSLHGPRHSSITVTVALGYRVFCSILYIRIDLCEVIPRATISEETSSEANQYVDEERDGATILEDVKLNDKNAFREAVTTEEIQEQLDTDDTGSILLLRSGAIVALWLASAIVGVIDSIPLFPNLMEVVCLAYTLWFSSRYLLFRKNRDELAAKIEDLKQHVLGSLHD